MLSYVSSETRPRALAQHPCSKSTWCMPTCNSGSCPRLLQDSNSPCRSKVEPGNGERSAKQGLQWRQTPSTHTQTHTPVSPALLLGNRTAKQHSSSKGLGWSPRLLEEIHTSTACWLNLSELQLPSLQNGTNGTHFGWAWHKR